MRRIFQVQQCFIAKPMANRSTTSLIAQTNLVDGMGRNVHSLLMGQCATRQLNSFFRSTGLASSVLLQSVHGCQSKCIYVFQADCN